MNIFKKRYGFLPLIIFIVQCQVEREEPIILGSPYLPLEIGNFWIYEVEETIYFGEDDFETKQYFYRDQITGQYMNEANEPVFIFSRQQSSTREVWQNEKVFSYTLSRSRLIRTIDNVQEIILVYPLDEMKEWDANGFNKELAAFYTIEEKGPFHLNERSFEEAVTIRKSKEDDFITIRDNRYEVFARDVGMVESYFEVFSYCSRNDCLGEQIIQDGRFTHLKLITYGKI